MTEEGNGARYTVKELIGEVREDVKALRGEVQELRAQVDKATGMGIVVRWLVMPVLVSVVTAAVLAMVGAFQ